MKNWKSTTQGLTPLDCPHVHITNSTLCCWLQLSQGGLIYDFKLFWKYNPCTHPLCHWHCIKIVVLVFWADNGDRRTKHQRRQHQRNYWRWGGRSSNHSGIFHFQGYWAIYQTLPLGSKSSIFDQIWSIYLIWRFHFYLKYKEKRAALDLFCKE